MKRSSAVDYDFYFGAKPEILKLANELRRNSTPSEKIIWAKIRKRQILGLKFKRQHLIDVFIADFYCHEIKLVIEIDGGIHTDIYQKERDQERDRIMKDYGIRILRFTNETIEKDIDYAIRIIHQFAENIKTRAGE